MTSQEILIEAVKRVGSKAQLARICGISPVAVGRWFKRGQIPAIRCKDIERATGINRKRLRPDIFK